MAGIAREAGGSRSQVAICLAPRLTFETLSAHGLPSLFLRTADEGEALAVLDAAATCRDKGWRMLWPLWSLES
eukprot:998850-Pleurochrysis_carterae.AAC.1